MRWYLIFALANVAMNSADVGIVQPIELTQFGIGFAGEDTLVTETAQSFMKPAEAGEEVDESQGAALLW